MNKTRKAFQFALCHYIPRFGRHYCLAPAHFDPVSKEGRCKRHFEQALEVREDVYYGPSRQTIQSLLSNLSLPTENDDHGEKRS